jgi:hypothetical protein
MAVKENILQNLEAKFNANPEGIKFVFGRPAVLYDSKFVLERFGDPDTYPEENWYEVVTNEFVPVAVADFDAGFISQPDVRAFSAAISLNLFVDFEQERDILPAIENICESLIGITELLPDGYQATYVASVPRFSIVEVYNDVRFIQYRVDITVLAMQDAFSLANVQIALALPSAPNTFVNLPVLAYSANRGRDTTVVQRPNTNTAKVLVKNSVWAGTIRFFLSTKTAPNLKSITEEMIRIIDDNTKNQNAIFNLRLTYPFIDYTITKPVLITNLQLDVSREEITSIQIAVEEAYTEILNPQGGQQSAGGGN